ncbi:N4-gp56 family major capsid protein [Lutimaribacter marinistellae]|uniref:N4-gp56 family major capsid protein n=1 Tax=Lutimaribacter marinistellae TaxID=1820329 RepID=A0ABV7TKT9_9RHOB
MATLCEEDLLRPKHYGKTIKVYQYVPLLDDRNVNDQGIDATGAAIANGNLYGSSRDVGTITSRLPTLSETGGRVNRVGFKRLECEGSITKMGFFMEFTQESFDFDTDADLYGHLSREMVTGATQLTEAVLQVDLLNGAGVTVYARKRRGSDITIY